MIAADAQNAGLSFELAGVYCQHGDWQAALLEIDRVEKLAPHAFPTDLLRGQAFEDGQQPAEARSALDRFLSCHPRHVRALTLRARARLALKETEAALADYRSALQSVTQLEPDLAQEVADALAAAGHTQEAVQVLDVAIKQIGTVPSLVLRAMELEAASGLYDRALSRVEVMRMMAPRPEPWMAKRASLLAQAGRVREGREAWQALSAHLATLPNLERGSHSMSMLAEEAHRAVAMLAAKAPDLAAEETLPRRP